MKTGPVPHVKDRKLKADPHYPAAVRRAKEAAQRLRDAGIIDAAGRRIRKDLPADMQLLADARREVRSLVARHGSLDDPALGPLIDAVRARYGDERAESLAA